MEVRLFGNFHARLVLDHYFAGNKFQDNAIVKHVYSTSLFAIYKMRMSEFIDFRIKAGAYYARVKANVTALGLTFDTSMADIGFGAGAGLAFQLSNEIYLYGETTVKYLRLDEPWIYVKGQFGIMYRIR
ncbi:MAG: hypothetical protein GY940_22395 [bacterium]|nr:hypothetical protein [bacterium]